MIRWGSWSFHLGFDQRVGPILSTVRWLDGERQRRILYQGHVAEMFVPYMDADGAWASRSYMDVGEYGFGVLASQLIAGSDCPVASMMIEAILADAAGQPQRMVNVMCLFERDTGTPAWRRSEVVTGAYEARPDIELVVRTIPTVGNYDYVYDWVFNSKGEIRIDIGATGIAAAKGVNARDSRAYGKADQGDLVDAYLAAPYHDHFLSFRLDLDVDGLPNRFVRDRLQRRPVTKAGVRSSLWSRLTSVQKTELALEQAHDPELWRVESTSARNGLGQATSFEILLGHGAISLLDPDDGAQRRAAFSASPLWVTVAKSSELYAAGDYPNQHPGGDGLPHYVDGESIEGADLVLWPSIGFHHVTRPEDWPVLSTVRHSLTLRPSRFFDRNPAMAVPRPPAAVSGLAEPRR